MIHDPAPEDGNILSNLRILSFTPSKRKPMVTEYVDVETGEIIDAKTAQKMGVRTIRPDARVRREAKLGSLRKEPRAFARFLLRFRDSHCKLLVGLDEVVLMYGHLKGMRPENVRRYFPSLIKAGVLDDDLTLNEDFMIHNPTAGRKTAKGDRFRAGSIFDGLLARDRLKATH